VAQLVAGLEPQTIGEWIEPLHHVTLHIQDRLAILFREGNRIERLNTARILAPFSIGNAELQYDLATTASHHQLQAVAKSFSLQRNEEVIQRLKSSLEEHNEIDNALEDKELDRLYGLRANAIALLANVDSVETFFASLQASEDETQRSFVIHRFAEVVTNKSALLDRLAEEDDNGVRQGIILTLGEVPLGDYSESDYERAKRLILHIFVHEPDAGVQGAAEWLLRRWNLHSAIKQVADQLPHAASPARDWYYTNLGYRMVIVRPQSYWVGTNPNEAAKFFVKNEFRRADIKFAFAIADRETCGSQFERFLEDHPRETERGENIISRYVRYEDCPVMNVTWYEAAHFCNWLSQREGIPEDQWCYTPNADGKYDAGMKIVAGRIHLTGYQLPIRECWQCAARGGTSTARPFGRGLELMPYYMWTQKSAKALAQPVAVTKPNRFGIFDALGNASEWSGGLTPRKGAIVDGFQITDQTKFAVLGGSLRVNERTIRSDYFNRKFGVARDDLPSTIRPMRIIVDPAKP
jgi:formylglycine-generating enzyme required for sulfatase activity